MKLTIVLLGLVFGSTSCKYEEGPNLSLRTKKARVAGEWEIEKATYSDGTVDTDFEGITIVFDKDGTGKNEFTGDLLGTSTTVSNNFKWEFTDSKKKLKITDEDGDIDESTILRLTNKEMWLKDTDNDQFNLKSK